MHEDYARAYETRAGSDRSFGLVMATALLVLGVAPMVRHGEPRVTLLVLAAAFALLALVRPVLLRPANVAWAHVGRLLNRVTSPVVLALVYVFAVVPMGILMRMAGKDPMRLRRQPDASSYWIPRETKPASMHQQF